MATPSQQLRFERRTEAELQRLGQTSSLLSGDDLTSEYRLLQSEDLISCSVCHVSSSLTKVTFEARREQPIQSPDGNIQ